MCIMYNDYKIKIRPYRLSYNAILAILIINQHFLFIVQYYALYNLLYKNESKSLITCTAKQSRFQVTSYKSHAASRVQDSVIFRLAEVHQ